MSRGATSDQGTRPNLYPVLVRFRPVKRPKRPMPDFVREALEENNVMDAYLERPAYQRNDYLGWIDRAKQEATKQKRLRQMIDELERGGVYMNMDHPPSARR